MSDQQGEIAAHIREALLAQPEVADWPTMRKLVERVRPEHPFGLLSFPGLASQSVGASDKVALPGAAALFCLHTSIHLVDDMIDREISGLYRLIGKGETANLALAFQAAGLRIIDGHPLHPERKRALLAELAIAAASTALGQALDATGVEDESGYWRVAEAKTPPLFKSALTMGALLGGASAEVAQTIGLLGRDIGIMIQIGDDLNDAMQVPAQPDWQRPNGNLALLYALTAQHEGQARFGVLCGQANDPEALREAQALLARSGAISYCCFRIAEEHRRATRRLRCIDVPNVEPLVTLVDHHVAPLTSLFCRVGIEIPPDLWLT